MTKKHSTKRAFIVSLLTLCLSFTMLLGTTYAWFTDSVSSTGNVIKSGRLDVGFYWADGATDPANTTWTSADKGAIFNNDLWEPGYTETKHIKITNEGTLSLAYKLAIIPHGEVSELADVIEVYYVAGATQVKDRTKLADDTALDSKYIGTLRDLIKNGIAAGTLEATDDNTTPADETEYTATIVLKMAEEAGNDYQGKSIGTDFSIQLLATQNTSEKDNFGTDYDKNAYFVVKNYAELKNAIDQALDTTTIFVQAGKYEFENVITMSDKEITIVGLGVVDFVKKTNYQSHLFNIADDSVVTIKNINMDGNGFAREGVFVRNNSTVTLENCYIGNTGGLDIMIDEASDNAHGKTTTSTVYLKNSHVEDVAMCASPTNNLPARQDTYAKFNFDAESSVVVVEKQSICVKPENCYINGDNTTDEYQFVLYAANDEQLADVLDRIENNSKYYNTTVLVKLAAGEYSEDYTINQYPLWNGVVGAGDSANNYASGVTGAAYTNITFAGQTATTYAANAVAVPDVVFTGNVTVKGFGNAGTGFGTATATTTFKNVGFDASESADEPKVEDAVVVYVVAAANDVNFESCYFTNATHVTVGGSKANGVGEVNFDKCYFDNGGCLSGYAETLTVTNTTVEAADNGFISNSKAGTVTVKNCTVNAGKYFLRTSNSGIDANVTNTTVTLYESDGSAYLVYFRGSNESITFTDCTLPANYTTKGVDADSTLEAYDFYDVSGVTYLEDEISGEVTLYVVSDDAPATLTIPEGVTTIGGWSFSGSNVKTVIMPSTVTRIAKKAFDGSAVEKVVLNEGLTEIETQAFSKANNLKEINFPSTLTTVGSEAFRLTAIETLTIPANVVNIDTGAFRDMPNLTTVIIEGDAVIANFAFRSCANLTTVKLLGTNVTFTGTSMAFSLADNAGNMSQITFYVDNQVIADRLAKAQGSAKGYNLVIKNPTNENGVIVDGAGNALAYDNEYLNNAISNGFDVIKLSSGEYIIPDSAANKNLTIVGNGDTTVAVQFDGSYEGCDYSLRGSTVVFENIVITTPNNIYAGWAGLKATFNNCTINGTYYLYDNTTFNNCTFNVSGDAYNIWTWGAPNATFNNCTFNTSGKAILLYGNTNTVLTVNNCVFNDDNKFADVNNKAAIEVGSDWAADTKTIIATNCTVNGFDVTNKGICTGTTLFGNKNSLTGNRLSVTVDGMTYVCVSNAEELTAAINAANDVDEIIVGDGTYNLRFTNDTTFNVDNLTITGVGNVKINVTSSEAWYGRVQGSNVTFENIHFTSSVGATGKAIYNDCTFDSWAICASSNNEKTTFNNCTINGCLNTSTDFSSGDVSVNNCQIAKAEYSGSMTMNFVNCQIGEIIIWNADTNLTNCQVTTLDTSNVTNATVTIK